MCCCAVFLGKCTVLKVWRGAARFCSAIRCPGSSTVLDMYVTSHPRGPRALEKRKRGENGNVSMSHLAVQRAHNSHGLTHTGESTVSTGHCARQR